MKNEIIKFGELVDEIGFKFFYGSLTQYNTQRDFFDKEIVLETFDIPLNRGCEYTTEFNIWVLIRKDIDRDFIKEGLDHLDFMLTQCDLIYDKMMESDFIRPAISKNKLTIRYSDAQQGVVLNSQNTARLIMPVKIWRQQ